MPETPASEPDRPSPGAPPVHGPLIPKRGAIPTPRSEIEAAEPYVPEPGPEPDVDSGSSGGPPHPSADDVPPPR